MTDIVIVTGSRYGVAKSLYNDFFESLHPGTIILVGDAKGVDSSILDRAEMRDIPVLVFSADWSKHGPKAGPLRNQEMVDTALSLAERGDLPITGYAFPLEGSKGTWDCVRRMDAASIPVVILRLNEALTIYDPIITDIL